MAKNSFLSPASRRFLKARASDRRRKFSHSARSACEALESRLCLSAVLNIPGISTQLAANDDNSSGPVDLATPVNFFGTSYSQLYVNNNGNVTFTNPLEDFTPDDLTSAGHIPEIAPFFADVDTTGAGSGIVTYGSTASPFDFGPGEGVHNAFVVNYPNVGYFASHTDKLNNFQLVLIDRSDTGAGNFDIEFNYDQIQWETGDESGGSDGLGGGSSAAAVGYTNGSGAANTFFELPGSESAGSLIDGGPDALISHSLNSSTPGQYIFRVRGGAVFGSSLDSTFAAGSANAVSLPFVTEQVVPTASGQIYAVGHQGDPNSNTSQGVIELLNSDGTPASSFGGNGVVTTDIANNYAFYGSAVDASGNIVVVGGSAGSFLVGRYVPGGIPDSTFGTGGFTTISFGAAGPATASTVAIEPDGSIVVGGQANNTFALARLTASGALDTSFNPGGADDATFPAGGQRLLSTGSSGNVTQLIVQGDGKILGVGSAGANVAAFRLNPDGSNDSSFGSGGIAAVSQLASSDPAAGGSPVLEGIAVQPGGSVLVSGEAPGGGFGAIRLDSTGMLDSTFNNGQTVVSSFGGTHDDVTALVANPADGQFVLIGTSDAGGMTQTAVAAFNPDGSVNVDFGISGQLTIPVLAAPLTSSLSSPIKHPGGPTVYAFHPQLVDVAFGAFQADGKLLVGSSGGTNAAVGRIQPFTASQSTIGNFGRIGRKNVKLAPFTLANGTVVTITLAGGSGTASFVGNNVSLTLSGNTSVTIRTRGGAGTVGLANVTSSGLLRSFNAPTATLNGTLTAPGVISTLKLAGISGIVIAGGINSVTANTLSGSIACAAALRTAKFGIVTGTLAAGQIFNLSSAVFSGAHVLAGANLGSDGQLGGTGGATDNFGAGAIITFRAGQITNSLIEAGVNPTDGLFADGDDTNAGGSIRSITAKLVDAQTRFESGVLPKVVHIPGKVIPAQDPRFIAV